MNEEELLEEQLNNLVAETCQHPQGSDERENGLDRLIRMIEESGKLWKDDSPYYEKALNQTWLYLRRNLFAYDPTKASLITWFNNHLKLTNLVVETCQHPQGSLERQRGLNKLIRIIQRSGKIWRDSSPDYEDALQQTWLYFCRNLCEAITAKSAYAPNKASITTWLNNYLRPRLLDLRIEMQRRQVTFFNNEKEGGRDIIDEIPASESEPVAGEDLLILVCTWIENDPEGMFRRTYIRDRPDANAQFLCLRILPYGKPNWQNLSTELGISVSTLSSFYTRKCIPLLKEIPRIDDFR